MNLIISFIIAYLLGSIPTSYIFGKLTRNIDIREHGSGNAGATNALRILGTKIGIITLLVDIGKGVAAVLIGKAIIGNPSDLLLILTGLCAILGHIFTVFLNFKGGKGVATSAGVFIALMPLPLLICLIIFILIVWTTRYVSLGSITASLGLWIYMLVLNINNNFESHVMLIFVTLVAGFIIIRHKANIGRLLSGNENKISFKKK